MATVLAPQRVDLSLLERWIFEELPALNNAIESGHLPPDSLLSSVMTFWRESVRSILTNLPAIDRPAARHAIQILAFPVSSLERHLQAGGEAPGTGVALLPGADHVLSILGMIAGHPPRDSHYTYWLWNKGRPPLAFIGDPQETFFNDEVNDTDRLHWESCSALRPICTGELAADSPAAFEALDLAYENTRHLFERYGQFMKPVEPGGPIGMEPAFFALRYRTYLPTYPINGKEWGGVNAANLASQMQLDYVTGTFIPEFYDQIVSGRLKYLTAEDRRALSTDIRRGQSVFDVLLLYTGLTYHDVLSLDTESLTRRLSSQYEDLRTTLAAYRRFVTVYGQLSARHMTLIHNYLVKVADGLTEEERHRLPVDPSHGTGGMKHEDTMKIMQMRHNHPIIAPFLAAVKLAIG